MGGATSEMDSLSLRFLHCLLLIDDRYSLALNLYMS